MNTQDHHKPRCPLCGSDQDVRAATKSEYSWRFLILRWPYVCTACEWVFEPVPGVWHSSVGLGFGALMLAAAVGNLLLIATGREPTAWRIVNNLISFAILCPFGIVVLIISARGLKRSLHQRGEQH